MELKVVESSKVVEDVEYQLLFTFFERTLKVKVVMVYLEGSVVMAAGLKFDSKEET